MLLSLDGSPCPAPLAGGLRLPGALPAVPPRALRGLSATAPPQLPAHVKNLHFHRVFHMSRELVRFQGTDLIKVITGVRRCGKSTLLDVMREHLRSQGVPDKRLLNRKGPRGGRPRRRGVREEGVPGGHGAASQLDNPRTRPSEKAVYIGTNVEYAPYVELGTSREKPPNCLRNSQFTRGFEMVRAKGLEPSRGLPTRT